MFPDYKKKFSKPLSTHMYAVIMVKRVHAHINMSTYFKPERDWFDTYVDSVHTQAESIKTTKLCRCLL